ncbi:MAG: esterase-like activity of phytase family protein, partial [Sphingobacteriaceae bacterium]|nr:esterase-like activity of phytase family protein [Cytophagaceae bacterium]
LPGDPNGLDPEGLVALPDGTFWISESYGPSLLHVDASGKTLERIGPNSTGRALPKVLARRRPGRGLSGLTITPDGKMLVGLMQSPLYNPVNTRDASRSLRILTFDLTNGATRQFVYLLDNPTYVGVSDLAALSNDTFLVLERDGNFLKNGTTPAKLLYKISLGEATDVSDPANGEAGRLVNGKTIDFASPAELQANGIKTVQKTLVVDLLKAIPAYPHDKPEGLALLSPTLLALSNDDDFGITAGMDGNPAQKRLPFTGNVDRGAVYFIRLDAALR